MATASGPLFLSVPPPLIPAQLPPPYRPEPEMSSFLISQLLPETPGLLWRHWWDIFYNVLLSFSHSVVSDSLQPRGLQHGRLAYPSLSSRACSNSCLLSRWCHPTVSSSVTPLSSSPQSCPASWSFPMNWLFTSVHQSIRASSSASVLPVNIQGWFPLGLTGLVSSQGTLKSFLQHHTSVQSLSHVRLFATPWIAAHQAHVHVHPPQLESINSLAFSLLYGPTVNICTWLLEKP